MRKFASFVFGSVMGAMFGAVVALLIAPSSGEELQAAGKRASLDPCAMKFKTPMKSGQHSFKQSWMP